VNSYLWDKTGAAPPEVEQMEAALARFRYQPQPLAWERATAFEKPRRLFAWRWAFVAAAAVVLISMALSVASRFTWRPGEPWRVTALAGAPRIADSQFTGAAKLSVGETLETDGASRARLHVASLGVIEVDPGTRLRLIATTAKHHRIALDYGTISARMWAPPFSLAVETQSAALFDLGCAFTMHAEPGGYGTVHVTSGWIKFEDSERNITVPAGGEAVTRPGIGPGTPYFSDAAPQFKLAIARFDTHRGDAGVRAAAVDQIVAESRPRDAFTLLNLLHEVPAGEGGRILDRLSSFVPIPSGYTREDVLAFRMPAMNAYWDAVRDSLHLDNPKSWIMNWRDLLAD
jgi:hypothetical protein